MTWTGLWRAFALLTLLLMLISPRAAVAQSTLPSEQAAWRAVAWLKTQQAYDGGFGDMTTTLMALHALGDAGENASLRRPGGRRLRDYVADHAEAYAARDAASAGRLIVALVAAGEDPRAFAGRNLLQTLAQHFDPTTGLYGGRVGTLLDQVWAALALQAAREPAPDSVVRRIGALQQIDGGWPAEGSVTRLVVTAWATAALRGAGVPAASLPMAQATTFLSLAQSDTGGFARFPGCGCAPDPESTAEATRAILALERDPLSGGWRRIGGAPTDWLATRQTSLGGVAIQRGLPPDVRTTALAISALLGRPMPTTGVAPAVRDALVWLRSRQQPDGGFAPVGGVSDLDFTLDAVFAIAAAGQLNAAWRHPAGQTPLDYLAEHVATPRLDALARLIIAVVALGGDPRDFGGVDLLARLQARRDPDTGGYSPRPAEHAWALLALASVHQAPASKSLAFLVELQTAEGGWRPIAEASPDTVTTVLALQALAQTSGYAEARDKGLTWLRARQLPDGGFGAYREAMVTSARATAAAIQALQALGEQPDSAAWSRHIFDPVISALPTWTPPRALLRLQVADGSFRAQPDFAESDAFATVQAIPALLGKPHPVARQAQRLFLPWITRGR